MKIRMVARHKTTETIYNRFKFCRPVFEMWHLDCSVGGSSASMATDIPSFDQGTPCIILQMSMKCSIKSCTCLHVIRDLYIDTIFN